MAPLTTIPQVTRGNGTPRAANVDDITANYLRTVLHSPTDIHLGAAGLSVLGLRALARTPHVASIIRTRNNQIAEWCRVQENQFSVGFRVRPVDRDKPLSRRVERDIRDVTDLLLNAGGQWFPGGLEGFSRALFTDSLIGDQAYFEIVKDAGRPVAFVPVDPTTIRRWISDEPTNQDRIDYSVNTPAFAQYVDGELAHYFAIDEMANCVRNPRSWNYIFGYGHPELEEMISVVSWLIHALATNGANYMTGVHGNMLLAFQTKMKKGRFAAVERMVQAALSGVRQNRKTPIIQLDPLYDEKIEPIELGKTSNADMQYADWINFLVKTICALYGIDPSELGFVFGNEGVKNQQYANSPLDRIVTSKERGLRPLVRSFGMWLNTWVVRPYWPHLQVEFGGFDVQTAKDKDESDAKAVTLWLSPNEVRANRGEKPLAHPAADLPLNTLFQIDASSQPEPVVEFDSVSAWVNGKRAQEAPFDDPA